MSVLSQYIPRGMGQRGCLLLRTLAVPIQCHLNTLCAPSTSPAGHLLGHRSTLCRSSCNLGHQVGVPIFRLATSARPHSLSPRRSLFPSWVLHTLGGCQPAPDEMHDSTELLHGHLPRAYGVIRTFNSPTITWHDVQSSKLISPDVWIICCGCVSA